VIDHREAERRAERDQDAHAHPALRGQQVMAAELRFQLGRKRRRA
jgi:hypothetical protein